MGRGRTELGGSPALPGAPPCWALRNYAISPETDPSGSSHCRTDIASSFPARATLMLKVSFCKMSSPHHPLAAWHSCSGAGVQSSPGLPFRTSGAAVKPGARDGDAGCGWRTAGWRSRERTGMLQTQGGEQRDGLGTTLGTVGGRGGGNQTHCARDEAKWREVNGQCHSRKRTKYIYINSLFYNHDKQKQKKNHIHTKI